MPADRIDTADGRHYDHAPIVEAVIEFQCELPKSVGVLDLAEVHSKISAQYPGKQEQRSFEILVTETSSQPTTAGGIVGYQFISQDAKQICHVRLNAFAFSRLAPYDRWESMRAEAHRLWEIYSSSLRPTKLTRVGVRYVNRIDVPAQGESGINLDDYFETAPRIASSLPQGLTNFFMRLQIPIEDAMLLLTETTVQPIGPNLVSTLLDVDVFVQQNIIDDQNAWHIVERLRREKNRAFEACITDKVRDLIK